MKLLWFLCFGPLLVCAAEGKTSVKKPSRLETAAIQIALDNTGFTPGAIDGKTGDRTDRALHLLKQANLELDIAPDPWIKWEIPEDFFDDLAVIPSTWLERSKLALMSYERPTEKIAEKFHLSEDFLKFLNPAVTNWTTISTGTTIKVPLLNPRKLSKSSFLRVSLSQKLITAFKDEDQIIASFPCSIAAKKEKRPVGTLQIQVIAPNPDYMFDPKVFPEAAETEKIKTKLMIPPGPNNPVGAMWLGLNLKGYGIHGTPSPEDIGKTESHGCFRLSNWDAARLARLVQIGTPVFIEE